MELYEAERDRYIEKLEKQRDGIQRILKMDAGAVLTDSLKDMRSFQDEADRLLRKLRKEEFEIAVVGMEKAGKSSFANAFMESNLLPTQDARCTFTSTKIIYSDGEGSATISFYKTDEFNEDFRDKLDKLGISSTKYSFDTLSVETYLKLYEEVSPEKKKIYGDTIHTDILDIIQNAEQLRSFLGNPEKRLAITGDGAEEAKDYITDKVKARAVKQVVICSSELRSMENAIIYDVPGFNSPTELHKQQTLERMKSADAIVLVANGQFPSITDEALKILHESDNDGKLLSDKLFVFANRIDQAKDIQKNIQTTYSEWVGKGFVPEGKKESRIFFGSALAHLEAAGLSSEFVLESFRKREHELPTGDGIKAIKAQLIAYNRTERFALLKQQINRLIGGIDAKLRSVIEKYKDISLERSYSSREVVMMSGMVKGVANKAIDALRGLRRDIRSNVPKEMPLSNQIREYIQENITVERCGFTEELLDRLRAATPYMGTHDDVAAIEVEARKQRFNEMYDDFYRNVVGIADRHHKTYSLQIIDILLEAMGVDPQSPYRNDLENALRAELSDCRRDLSLPEHIGEQYYQSLIERFSRNIYQILIASQYNSERLREFYDSIDELFSLSVFYRKDGQEDGLSYIGIAPMDQPLCMMLLFHDYSDVRNADSDLGRQVLELVQLADFPDPECWKLLRRAYQAVGYRRNIILDEVRELLPDVADKPDVFKQSLVANMLADLTNRYALRSIADREQFEKCYTEYHSSLRNGCIPTLEDVCEEFNTDIRLLNDVLTNAFIRAIKMENPFVAREVKSLDDIIAYVESARFNEFFADNFWRIRYKDIAELDRGRRVQEQNAAIVNEIKGILDSTAG